MLHNICFVSQTWLGHCMEQGEGIYLPGYIYRLSFSMYHFPIKFD